MPNITLKGPDKYENDDEDYFRCSSCGRVLHKRLLAQTYEDEPICEDCQE